LTEVTLSVSDAEDRPLARHSLEGMATMLCELDSRVGDEVADGRGGEHLAIEREVGDARRDVHGDATDVVAAIEDGVSAR
jgi:hypothetical protein